MSNTVSIGQEVYYNMVYIAYHTKLNWQICKYAQKRRICCENSKNTPDKKFCGHFCAIRKAATPIAQGDEMHWKLHPSVKFNIHTHALENRMIVIIHLNLIVIAIIIIVAMYRCFISRQCILASTKQPTTMNFVGEKRKKHDAN